MICFAVLCCPILHTIRNQKTEIQQNETRSSDSEIIIFGLWLAIYIYLFPTIVARIVSCNEKWTNSLRKTKDIDRMGVAPRCIAKPRWFDWDLAKPPWLCFRLPPCQFLFRPVRGEHEDRFSERGKGGCKHETTTNRKTAPKKKRRAERCASLRFLCFVLYGRTKPGLLLPLMAQARSVSCSWLVSVSSPSVSSVTL